MAKVRNFNFKLSIIGRGEFRGPYNPWGAIKTNTPRRILDVIYKEAKTVSQISRELKTAQSTIHKHVQRLLSCDVIKEVDVPTAKIERYYTVNFPVVTLADQGKLKALAEKIAKDVINVYENHAESIREVFKECDFARRGWDVKYVFPYLGSEVEYILEKALKEEGLTIPYEELPKRPGDAKWIIWAIEQKTME